MRSRHPGLAFSPRRRGPLARPALPLLSLAAGLLGGLGVGGAALGAIPVGSEFQVNTYTTDFQRSPSVAVDADGDFVVVWPSGGAFYPGPDGSSSSVQGQRYDASGSAVGSEFQVNTYTTGAQGRAMGGGPSVAVDADGDFVVVWMSEGSSSSDTDGFSIQGQRYDASGNAVGSEFQVNSYTTDDQWSPSVAVDADGDFVVAWRSEGSAGTDTDGLSIQGQRYDASGTALGAQFQVNTYTTGQQGGAWIGGKGLSVAVGADGGFVVVWDDSDLYPSWVGVGSSIQGQRYDASGTALGAQFQVNTFTNSYYVRQYNKNPSVAAEADGSFVVVWESARGDPYACCLSFIQGQRHDASGSAVGSQFEVYTGGSIHPGLVSPSVATVGGGDFVVVWPSSHYLSPDGSGTSIQGQRYDGSGSAVDSEFQVNSYTTDDQLAPSVAADADGDFVVAWTSYGSAGTDTDAFSIQGQRYALFHHPPVPALSAPALGGLAALLIGVGAAALRKRPVSQARRRGQSAAAETNRSQPLAHLPSNQTKN